MKVITPMPKKKFATVGITPLKKIKGINVILAENAETSDLIILKKVSSDDRIEEYISMREAFERTKHKLGSLIVPEYLGRHEDYDMFSHISGTSVEWSEESGEPGFGGENIPDHLAEIVLDASDDLDHLGYWNGDFYWRNFIFPENGKIGVVDWDRITQSSKSKASRLSYIFCLTFNNTELRHALAKGAASRGHIERKRFRKGVLRTTSRFIEKWPKRMENIARLKAIHDQFADDDKYDEFWEKISNSG